MRKLILILSLFVSCHLQAQIQTSPLRDRLDSCAKKYIGIREATGNNDGPAVEKLLANVGLPKGFAWCAAYQTQAFDDAKIKNPHSAFCPDWFKTDIVYRRNKPTLIPFVAKKGQNVGFYIESKGRVGHIGMIYAESKFNYSTREGNTNEAGSDEGEGAYNKIRNKKTIFIIADHVK